MALATETATAERVTVLSADEASPKPTLRDLGGEQIAVAGGQLAAGAGNLLFALLAARLLDPSGFARLSVFLGLYLVLSLPATSLSAATALDPGRRDVMLLKVARISVAGAAALAAASPIIAPALNIPISMVLALSLAVPAGAPLALDRGRLYGSRSHGSVIASLVAEPAVRLSLGLGLAAGIGPVGAAAGVVVAAYAAREVARARSRRFAPAGAHFAPQMGSGTLTEGSGPATRAAGWAAAAFALLSVVQSQDLVFANTILGPRQAGAYAALSTLGGAAAFATVTIPLVLMPRAVKRERHSLSIAVGLAVLLGLATITIGAIAPKAISAALFGSRYGSVGRYVVPYLSAMALLGVGRVLVAHACATGAARRSSILVGIVAVVQALAIVAFGHSVGSIAGTTVAATAVLALLLGVDAFVGPLVARMGAQLVLPRPVRLIPDIKHLSAGAQAWIRRMASDRTVRALAALLAIGLALRFFILRGIWLDEATSIHQATMPFGAMIKDLRNTDVHPPLYFSVLWATDRLFGDGALAMRIPSILAGCVAIPVAYVTGRDLWDRRTGLVAAAMASVAPILVWYSQEIRMYSMFMLFALLALWGQARALRTNRVSDWAIYVLASAALVWTEYFAVFQVIAQQAVFVGVAWRRHGERARRFAVLGVATFVILALVAPLVPFAWHQFMVNQNAGKGFGAPSQVGLAGVQSISVYTVLANLAWAVVGYHSATVMAAVVALWPVGILLALFLLGRRMTENTVAVLGSALVPAVLLLGVGMAKRNLFDVRYMSGVVVALLLLTARLITGGTRDRRFQVAACAMVIAILSLSLGDEQVNGSNPRLYDFAGALHAVLAQARPGDLLMYDPGDLGLVVSYYAPRVHSTTVPAPVSERATPGSEVFVLASPNLMNGSQPSQLGQLLSRLSGTDRAIGTIHRANVTVWVFRVPAPSSAAAPASAVAPSSGGRP